MWADNYTQKPLIDVRTLYEFFPVLVWKILEKCLDTLATRYVE